MGTKGATAGATRKRRNLDVPASLKANLEVPQVIANDVIAKDFFVRHAQALSDADMLSATEIDGFILLCKVYSQIWATDPNEKMWRELISQYRALSKSYGLEPLARKKMAVSFKDNTERYSDKDAFDF